jgi:hypothetical protein
MMKVRMPLFDGGQQGAATLALAHQTQLFVFVVFVSKVL